MNITRILVVLLIAFMTQSTGQAEAQSKTETEEWIAHKIVQYLFEWKTEVNFSNQNMYIKYQRKKSGDYYYQLFSHKIPLRHIKYISFRELSGGQVELIFSVSKSGPPIVKTKIYDRFITREGYPHIPTEKETSSTINYVFKTGFSEDNLPNRMKKAFKNLVRMNGGELKDEAY